MRRIFLLALILFGPGLMAADYPLWGKLTPGDHAVGFTARFEYDYSRTFRAKTDLDGKMVAGNRARPIQIAIWYPTKKASTNFMKYEEYAYLLGQELEFGPSTEQIKNAGLQQFSTQRRNFSSASQAAIDQLLQTKTAAVKDATPAAGKFPLIVYAPGASGTSVENPVFCEFLASHGYIVAALPSLGAYARTASIDLTGFYAHMQDIEFVIGYMQKFPNIDPDHLALAGFSMGGSAATLVQMRNFDIDAVVYLDTGIIFPIVESWFRPSNYYNPSDLRAPQLYLTRADAPDINVNFLDSIPYADTHSLLFEEGYRHVDFISDGIFTGVIPGYLPEKVKNAQQLFEFISQYSLQFLNAYVRKDPQALAQLKKKPQEWGVSPSFVSAEFKPAAKAPPREWELTNLIREGGFDRAKVIYEEQKRQNPKTSIFRENVMNAMGYEFLFRGNRDMAIKILSLNAEAFPKSANANDSLSEAYETAGNKELALQFAEKGIALLAQDTSLDDRRREVIKRILEDRVKKLKGM
jgi:pimeloyl-ACP methyl ester carboxylesterase